MWRNFLERLKDKPKPCRGCILYYDIMKHPMKYLRQFQPRVVHTWDKGCACYHYERASYPGDFNAWFYEFFEEHFSEETE